MAQSDATFLPADVSYAVCVGQVLHLLLESDESVDPMTIWESPLLLSVSGMGSVKKESWSPFAIQLREETMKQS